MTCLRCNGHGTYEGDTCRCCGGTGVASEWAQHRATTERPPMPKRIQMTRQKPWRADNPDAVIVDRRTKWGNPYRIGASVTLGFAEIERVMDAGTAVRLYRRWLTDPHPVVSAAVQRNDLHELRGRDLACWCDLASPCHADVLLELANAPAPLSPDHSNQEKNRDA